MVWASTSGSSQAMSNRFLPFLPFLGREARIAEQVIEQAERDDPEAHHTKAYRRLIGIPAAAMPIR